jgi:hypothetical protein
MFGKELIPCVRKLVADHDTAGWAASERANHSTVFVMPLSRVCIAESSVAASSVRVFSRHGI